MTTVAMLLNARGDYLLNLPALRALSTVFGDTLTVVSRPGARHTFFPDLPLAGVVEPDLEHTPRGPVFDADALARELPDCDLLLSLNPWHNESADAFLAALRPPASVGFAPAFSVPLRLDFGRHSGDLAFDVPRAVDPSLRFDAFTGPPRLDRRYVDLARRLVDLVPRGTRIICAHGDTKPDKTWPMDRFRRLVCWLLGRDPDAVVFDLGLDRRGLACRCHRSRVIPCRRLVLPAAIALVGLSDLFVGVDSCFLHAADLYRVPGVGLFGPTDSHEFGFLLGPHRHLDTRGPLTGLSTTAVIEAVERLEQDLVPRREGVPA